MLAKKDTLDTVVVENDTDDTNGDTNEALVMRWIAENPTITQQCDRRAKIDHKRRLKNEQLEPT